MYFNHQYCIQIHFRPEFSRVTTRLFFLHSLKITNAIIDEKEISRDQQLKDTCQKIQKFQSEISQFLMTDILHSTTFNKVLKEIFKTKYKEMIYDECKHQDILMYNTN